MNRDERKAALADKLEPIEDRTERIFAKNQFEDFPVYRAPTELLVLNPRNRRFRAELQEVEQELGRSLDPDASDHDEQSVISLLLDREPYVDGDKVVGGRNKDTIALVADWDKRHQERPFWIRPDGLVSNGNRRLAMLRRLQEERGAEGYDWVDVVVFDEETYDDETLFEMEAREQLTEGMKIRYTKMNLLLTLKDAAERHGIDWYDPDSIEEVSHKIQDLVSSGPAYAKVQLQAIKYMDEYLKWLDRPGDYASLRRQVERFRDVGKNMAWVATEDPEREAEMLEICFQAISVGAPHPDIREIRVLLKQNPNAFDEVVKEIEEADEEPEEEGEEESVVEEPVSDTDDELEQEDAEQEAEEETAPEAVPLSKKKKRIKRVVDVGVKKSRAAREKDPQAKVHVAQAQLDSTDVDQLFTDIADGDLKRLQKAIESIRGWVDAAEKALAKAKPKDD